VSAWPPDPGDAGDHPSGGRFVFPADLASWRAWLEAHHDRERQVWLILPKKGVGLPGLALAEAVDEALCWGWTDSRPGTVDELRWALAVMPRQPGSVWSPVNRRKVETLLAAGRIAPPGLATIEAARRDGSWSRLGASDALELPVDLVKALARDPAASEGWRAFPPLQRERMLAWILDSRRPSMRAARIRDVVAGARDRTAPLAMTTR
jgi:uncharacterized protein YdeI (YjbR/CyaY-like superfamily)